MSAHLAIVLPGRGYGADLPALYLPRRALEQAGAETGIVAYSAADDWPRFHAAVDEAVGQLIDERSPSRVTFVAKSLGTIALAALSREVALPPRVDAVWITPLFGEPQVREGAIAHGWRSLIVAGAADPYNSAPDTEAVRVALGADVVVAPDADHGLEVPGDVIATIDGLRAVVEAVVRFVS